MADDAAYQGVPGAFSEQAAREAVGHDARLLPCATFEEVFDAIRDGRVRCAVVPVENELAGPVAPVVRLLAEREVEVTGELTLRIAQALIAAPGATPETIRRVRSHPMALAQCAGFFARHPQFVAVEDFDTAGAVEAVVRAGSIEEAAIGARRAADVYGGVVLEEEIQDSPENRTRFAIVVKLP
jgi:prephenate dehydratase